MSQVDESSTIEAGRSRTISLASKFNLELNAQPIKVALIVDNSTTMLNSQTNLARNLSSLFSELSKYDTEVTVLSTSWRYYLQTKSESVRVNSTTTRNITRKNFDLRFIPTIKILKTDSNDEKNLKFKDIGDAVKRLGTDGSDDEAALQTLAFSLQGMPEFFTDDARLLVYIITDENNLAMSEYVQKYYETLVRQLPPGPVTRSYIVATFTTFNLFRLVESTIYQDGIPVGTTIDEIPTPAASVADCNAKHRPPDVVCRIENSVNSRFQAKQQLLKMIRFSSFQRLSTMQFRQPTKRVEPSADRFFIVV